MDFYDILDQVVALLKERRRVTYGALQAQFQLDDGLLETLKDELLFSHPVIDKEGRGLEWIGEKGKVLESTSQPDQPESQPIVEPSQLTLVESKPVEPPIPEAERRQLTVMFCDLVGSTSLSSELDPEDLRDVIREYQNACTEVIQRYDGYVAQLLGDGLLVYFGYPVAHEDDAQRAIHAGLGILNAIETLNNGLKPKRHIALSVRLGLHTGLVVVGEMGGEGRQEQLALGETPNIAARVQGLAEPDTLIISDATYQLVQGFFDCDPMGEHDLKGVTEPVPIYRVLNPSGAQHRLDTISPRGLTPLVGRRSELQLLIDRWNQAKSSEGQVVLLNAEPGLGKSRMVQALREHLLDDVHTRLECRSSPYYQNTALYPVIDLVQRTLHWHLDDSADEKFQKLEQALSQYRLPAQETVPLMADLLSLALPEDKYPPFNLTPQRYREKTLETIVAMLVELAERKPVLFVLEDLHWTDPSTLDLLDLLVAQTPTAPVYVLLTCRPEFQAQWTNRSYFTQVTLSRLSRSQIESIAMQVAGGKLLPHEVMAQLVERTDGVPLYVEEMTKSVLESRVLKESDGQYELTGAISTLSIPATLQDSLMARLDRLVTAKSIAQQAAVIGRQFSYTLLQAVAQVEDSVLERELGLLVDAELVYQQGIPPQATYIFKHALVTDIAYESLLRSTRQGYHRRIAEVLEKRVPATAETQPELLARHYTEAGLSEQAVAYWQQAGDKAIQRSAYVEAIAHLTQGLTGLRELPDTPERLSQELDFQVVLGNALRATQGSSAPEVERAYARAQALCEQVGETPQLFPVLRGLMQYYQQRGQLQTTYTLGEQLLSLAQSQSDTTLLMLAHSQLGTVLLFQGKPAAAQTHHTQALTIYSPQEHRALALRYGLDLGVVSGICLALELWQLGYPDQAMQHSQAARRLAEEVSHPYSLATALFVAAIVHQHRREVPAARGLATAATTLTTEQGFSERLAWSIALHGWALAMEGQSEVGIAELRQGLDADLATGSMLFQPYFLGLLAEACGEAGQPDAGLHTLGQVAARLHSMESLWYQAELHRLKGTLLLRRDITAVVEAEACLHEALEVARHQHAKSLELRVTTSLARLWQSQGKRQKARDLLAPVYDWFTEGFDTTDLKEAKALLTELEG